MSRRIRGIACCSSESRSLTPHGSQGESGHQGSHLACSRGIRITREGTFHCETDVYTSRYRDGVSLSPLYNLTEKRERERDTLSSLHRRSLSPLYIEKRDTLSYLSRRSLSHRDRDERHLVPSIEKEYLSYREERENISSLMRRIVRGIMAFHCETDDYSSCYRDGVSLSVSLSLSLSLSLSPPFTTG